MSPSLSELENHAIKEETETKSGNILGAPNQGAPEAHPTRSLQSDVNEKIPILAQVVCGIIFFSLPLVTKRC